MNKANIADIKKETGDADDQLMKHNNMNRLYIACLELGAFILYPKVNSFYYIMSYNILLYYSIKT